MSMRCANMGRRAAANGFNDNIAMFAAGKCGIWFDATVAAPFLSDPKPLPFRPRWVRPAAGSGIGSAFRLALDMGLRDTRQFAQSGLRRNLSAGRLARPMPISSPIDWAGSPPPPGTRKSLYTNPTIAAWRPSRTFPERDQGRQYIVANRQAGALCRRPICGNSRISGIGTEVGQQFSAAVAGQITPDEALAEAQAAAKRQMAAAGYYHDRFGTNLGRLCRSYLHRSGRMLVAPGGCHVARDL